MTTEKRCPFIGRPVYFWFSTYSMDIVLNLHNRLAFELVSSCDVIFLPIFATKGPITRKDNSVRTIRRNTCRQMYDLNHYALKMRLIWQRSLHIKNPLMGLWNLLKSECYRAIRLNCYVAAHSTQEHHHIVYFLSMAYAGFFCQAYLHVC